LRDAAKQHRVSLVHQPIHVSAAPSQRDHDLRIQSACNRAHATERHIGEMTAFDA
jgi:hypothetical protein